jgi:hypothetical protein
MTTGAIIFMALSWSFVLGLTFWSFRKMLSVDKRPESVEAVETERAPEG